MEFDQWLAIELRHLAALRAISATGSFRGAAVELGYTQSAISQQIATLEKHVGVKLVERPGGPRKVSLTEAGRLLLRHADAIVARLHAAQADVAALAAGEAGDLRVGTFQSVGARVLPTVLRRFADARPNVAVRVLESTTDQGLLEAVERGELDLAFAMPPLPSGPFDSVELLRDDWLAVVAADSALAARRTITLAELAEQPLIGSRTCRSREQLDAAFHTRGVTPSFAFESDENSMVHGVVASGVGVALLPRLSIDENDARVTVLALEPPIPPRPIALAWHRDRYRPPAAETFVELARAVGAELATAAAAGVRSRGRRRLRAAAGG